MSLIVLATIAGIYGYKEFNRDHIDLKSEKASVSIDANTLLAAYQINEDSCNKLYLDQVIAIKGNVIQVEAQGDSAAVVYLGDSAADNKVSCTMDKRHLKEALKLKIGTTAVLKGKCNGYLMDVELNQCVIE